MLKVDSIIAADTSYLPKPKVAQYSESTANVNSISGMAFGDYLNMQLQEKVASAQSQVQKSYAASVLALYYPPLLITSRLEEKPK